MRRSGWGYVAGGVVVVVVVVVHHVCWRAVRVPSLVVMVGVVRAFFVVLSTAGFELCDARPELVLEQERALEKLLERHARRSIALQKS